MYTLKTPKFVDRTRIQSEMVKFLDEQRVALTHRREVIALILGSIVAGSLPLPVENEEHTEYYRSKHANNVNAWLGRLAEFFTFDQSLAAVVAFEMFATRVVNAYPKEPFVIAPNNTATMSGVVKDIAVQYPKLLGPLPWSIVAIFAVC